MIFDFDTAFFATACIGTEAFSNSFEEILC